MEIRAHKGKSIVGLSFLSMILILLCLFVAEFLKEQRVISSLQFDRSIYPILIGLPILIFYYFYSTVIVLYDDRVVIHRFFRKREVVFSNLIKGVEYGKAGLLPYYELNPQILVFYDSSRPFPKTFIIPAFDESEINKLGEEINSKIPKQEEKKLGYLKVSYWIDQILKWGVISIFCGLILLYIFVSIFMP